MTTMQKKGLMLNLFRLTAFINNDERNATKFYRNVQLIAHVTFSSTEVANVIIAITDSKWWYWMNLPINSELYNIYIEIFRDTWIFGNYIKYRIKEITKVN